ncbi:MAG: FAD-binding oxidoreductase [Kyrpidia sp.]|nr:FAD-binding oxidoreductase [Kyrpidia sp.]
MDGEERRDGGGPGWWDDLQKRIGESAVAAGFSGAAPDAPWRAARAVRPADESQAVELVRWACDRNVRLLPLGAGTEWIPDLPDGDPPLIVTTGALTGVTEYKPGDLVMVVRSGTPWREVQRIAGEQGQWLPVDPLVQPEATLGGVISCAASGPHRLGYGPIRDWVIGLRAVTADGLIRMGGKVVKNVAGYDVTKLFVGARGTLGLITEAAVKLRPLPADRRLLALSVEDPRRAESFARALSDRPWTVTAAEWVNPALAEACGLPGQWTLLLGCDESSKAARSVTEGWRALAMEHGLQEIGLWRDSQADDLWDRYRTALGAARSLRLRWVTWPTRVIATALEIAGAANPGAGAGSGGGMLGTGDSSGRVTGRLLVSAGICTGDIRATVRREGCEPASQPERLKIWAAAVTESVRPDMGRAFIERIPPSWAATPSPTAGLTAALGATPDSILSRQLKQILDPRGVFVPAGVAGGA